MRKALCGVSVASMITAGVLLFLMGGTAAGISFVASLCMCALCLQSSSRTGGLAFTVWVFAFAAAAYLFPGLFIRWGEFQPKTLIVPLIQVTLFGMGMTLTAADFLRVAEMPRAVLTGLMLQYTVMPAAGWTFALLFGLSPEIAAGLVLIGSCPGGVASNVIAYLAGVNVALSVTMTAFSTLASPLATPVLMKYLAGRFVEIEMVPMMLSIVQMIILPLAAGLLVNRYAHGIAARASRILPFIAMMAICLIIAITIALSRDDFLAAGAALFGASACHNAAGYLLGFYCAKAAGLTVKDARTVAIEVGMQNGGMATGLAFNVLKSAQAALASAVFGPWSAITSSVLASVWRRNPA